MNNSKREYRSSEAVLKRRKKYNRRPKSKNKEYIERKNVKRSKRLSQNINKDKDVNEYTKEYIEQRLGEKITDDDIRNKSSERRNIINSMNEIRRSDDVYRRQELENQRNYELNRQQLRSMWEYIEETYRNAIKEGPVCKCSSCNGRFFRKSMHSISKSKIIGLIGKDVADRIITQLDNEILLCFTCENQIKKRQIPKLCTRNGLELDPIPDLLKICNSVEERLFSPIIPFEQIRALGFYGKQLGIKGNVVNVPIDLPQTIECLPRKLEDCHTIQIKFKRMVSHKSDYLHETIRPARVWNAINYLCQQSLFKEHNIEINLNWMKTFGSSEEIEFVVNSEDKDFLKITSNNMDQTDLLRDQSEERLEYDDNESQSSDEEFIELGDNVNPGESETVIQNNGLIMAPGEGQKPISFYSTDCEYLAFPKIYCGKSFNLGNPNNLTISELAKYKLRYYDRRFAECPQILFFLLRQKQIENLRRSINIVLKKKRPNT